MNDQTYIPMIDFSKCGLLVEDDNEVERSAIVKSGAELYKAFKTSGFAYLSNTGIPSEVVEELNATTQQFFDLPLKEKLLFREQESALFYDPPKQLMVNKTRGYDLSEALRVHSPDFADESIVWPDTPHLKQSALRFMDETKKLALRVFKALGVGMNLKDPDYFYKCHSLINQKGNPTYAKSGHYYPLLDNSPEDGKIGTRIGEHSDGSSITFLFHDDIGGLQVLRPDGKFQDAVPIPGAVIVNIGDELQFWSGNRLKSTVHRVLCPTDPEIRKRSRRVAIMFISADDDVPLSELEFSDGAGEYKPDKKKEKAMTSLEFVHKRFLDDRPNLSANNQSIGDQHDSMMDESIEG